MTRRAAREEPWKPTRAQLEAARDKIVKDVIANDLLVLFCGINPGLYTAAVGHHFARPGNRFWPALAASGFTSSVLSPFDEAQLLEERLGITNLVMRTTATAAELGKDEIREGAKALERKVKRRRPRVLALLGITTYRIGWNVPKAKVGLQKRVIGQSAVWLLPNPSGLNAHYQPADLANAFRELKDYAGR